MRAQERAVGRHGRRAAALAAPRGAALAAPGRAAAAVAALAAPGRVAAVAPLAARGRVAAALDQPSQNSTDRAARPLQLELVPGRRPDLGRKSTVAAHS